MARALAAGLVAMLGLVGSASARPVEDGARISILAGARYVPHRHFELLAQQSGIPVISSWPVGPEVLASFSYAPSEAIELSLEVGWSTDHYQFSNTSMAIENIPLVASLRWFPFATRFAPYLGAGAGYMLGFVSGAPSDEVETHAQEFHALIGASYAVSDKIWLLVEDRFQIASGDIIPIGQIQTGGNALFLGVSFVLEPVKDLAPH